MNFRCYAACLFGLESIVAAELRTLELEEIETRDARVYFSADEAGIARANLCLSSADRIYLILGQFRAVTFDELFEQAKALPFEEFLPRNARFPVAGDAVKSVLGSVSDVQSIVKKAAVEAMKRRYGLSFYKEDGDLYPIYVNILRDEVTISLNTSGAGLNRRGYRVKNAAAPLRETLAAGMIGIARWWEEKPFYDYMCGSGTIAIEAAMKATGRAPGLNREFTAQVWRPFEKAFHDARMAAREAVHPSTAEIFASDIDNDVLNMARYHAQRAGVADAIQFSRKDARDFLPNMPGTLISNPPYAMRMGEKEEVHALYRAMGEQARKNQGMRWYFICADQEFERFFGKKADKKRKLYNGNVRCEFYQYFRKEKEI